jgi:hypothetical protein
MLEVMYAMDLPLDKVSEVADRASCFLSVPVVPAVTYPEDLLSVKKQLHATTPGNIIALLPNCRLGHLRMC